MACVHRRKLAHDLTAMIEHHVFPCETRFAEIEHLPPFSPFNTLAYARARAALGDEPQVFLLRESGRLEAACVASFPVAASPPDSISLHSPSWPSPPSLARRSRLSAAQNEYGTSNSAHSALKARPFRATERPDGLARCRSIRRNCGRPRSLQIIAATWSVPARAALSWSRVATRRLWRRTLKPQVPR